MIVHQTEAGRSPQDSMAKSGKKGTSKTTKATVNNIDIEIGKTSEVFYSGSFTGNTDYNKDLVGKKRIKEFDKMRLGDSTVAACLNAIMLPILCATWHFDPASEDSLDVEVKDFVEDNLFNKMSRTWAEFLAEALIYLVHGNRIFEQVYEFSDDGKIRIHKFAHRPSDTIDDYKLKNGDLGVVQKTIKGTYEIPIEKLLILVNRKEGDNWEGQSIFRAGYRNYRSKDTLITIDCIAAERQGLGVPRAKLPTGTAKNNPELWRKTVELLRNMRADEGGYMIYEAGTETDFMDMKANTTKDLTKSIAYHDRQIEKSVLADFLSLGATSTGSYALSSDKTEMFLLSLEAIANYICACVDEYVVKRLVDLNYNVTNYPKLKFSGIRKEDIAKLSAAVSTLVTAKALTPDGSMEDYLRTIMNLPERTDLMNPEVLNLASDMFNELDQGMAELDGGAAPQDPTQDPSQQVDQTQADEDEILETIMGGVAGQPLSEETKRKISEALKKLGPKANKGKKKQNPEIKKKQAQINELRSKIREFKTETQKKLLKLASKGEKLDPKKLADTKLKLLDKQSEIMDQIDQLKGDIATLRASEWLDSIEYEKFAEVLDGDLKDVFMGAVESLKSKLDTIIEGDEQRPAYSYKL